MRLRTGVVVALLLMAFVSPAAGQDPTAIVTIDDSGHISIEDDAAATFFAAQAVPVTDFEMFPTVRSSESRRNLIYICRNANNENVSCAIDLVLRAVALSGGHDHHDDNRPRGTLSATAGSTGTNGFSTVFTAPQVGGVIELQVNLVFPPVPPSTQGQPFSFVQTFGITVPGLMSLPPGNWVPVGAVAGQHTDNHYGTALMNELVLLTADEYRSVFNGVLLELNDMSLAQGGLFDAYGTNLNRIWAPPHASHRFGTDVDVRLPPRENRRRFLAIAESFNLQRIVEPGPLTHYHLRLR